MGNSRPEDVAKVKDSIFHHVAVLRLWLLFLRGQMLVLWELDGERLSIKVNSSSQMVLMCRKSSPRKSR